MTKPFEIVNKDYRDYYLLSGDLMLVDPPYNLNKVYDGEKEFVPYYEWVNDILNRTVAPWRIFFAPPMGPWFKEIPQPDRIIYWCKTFVQLRTLNWWQYAVTPILVYREPGAPWYGPAKGTKRDEGGLSHFDWLVAPSAITDLKITRKFYHGGHPGVTGTKIAGEIIRNTTKEGDLVLDPMCGLGSIPVAALREGRKAFGIEISETYSDCAQKWCDYTLTNMGVDNSELTKAL